MSHNKKEEFLTIFSIALALVAVSVLVYTARTPSLTGTIVLDRSEPTTVAVVMILILAGIAVIVGAIIAIHKLKKEIDIHKKVIEKPTNVNLQLVQYVLKAKQNGFSDHEIIERLKKQGWKPTDVRKSMQ